MLMTAVAASAEPVSDGWTSLRATAPPTSPVSVRLSGPQALLICYADLMKVPADLALALAEVESAFNPNAVSKKNARGILQVLPNTARQYRLNPERLLELEYGTYAGLVIVRDLLNRFPVEAALAGYFAGGEFYVQRYSQKTQKDIGGYVQKVLDRRRKYQEISFTGCR